MTNIDSFEEFSRGRCSYSCAMCSFTSSESLALFKHVKERHGMDTAVFAKLYPGYAVAKVKITCAECGAAVTFDPTKLSLHTFNKHKLTLKAYYNKHVTNGTSNNAS